MLDRHLQLYPVTSATEPVVPLLLSPGSTRFSFEMPLPAGIPETISCPQITVDYNITVCMEYKKTTQSAGVLHEEIKKRVILARLPDNGMLTGENYPITIDSHKHFSNYCQYRITVDKKSAALGTTLPVKIEIAPTVKDLRIKQIFLQLVEKRTVSPEEGEEKTSQSVHFLYPTKGSSIALPTRPLYTNWTGNFLYQIPDEKTISHSTQSYSQFHIHHILLVSLLVTFPETHGQHYGRHVTRTISFQTQFDLLDSHLSSEREYTKLPSYNCPVSIEEIEKLYQHGLGMDNPPSYEESLPTIL
ncbi:MAG: hypothetical protein EXX96DRAFT_577613 [Benjaminiella poitrasii]|nr:MAG: hypothetical protein EXX96DRAFT_577613 [Benjaminiella poitrasii]